MVLWLDVQHTISVKCKILQPLPILPVWSLKRFQTSRVFYLGNKLTPQLAPHNKWPCDFRKSCSLFILNLKMDKYWKSVFSLNILWNIPLFFSLTRSFLHDKQTVMEKLFWILNLLLQIWVGVKAIVLLLDMTSQLIDTGSESYWISSWYSGSVEPKVKEKQEWLTNLVSPTQSLLTDQLTEFIYILFLYLYPVSATAAKWPTD